MGSTPATLILLTVSIAHAWCTTPTTLRRVSKKAEQRASPVQSNLLANLLEHAEVTHARECADGALNFAAAAERADVLQFSDEDFETRVVGPEPMAGPDWRSLRHASSIHHTRQPVVSDGEVDALVSEAGAAIASGARSNFSYTEQQNLGEVHTADLPMARAWLARRLSDTFYPLVADRFGLEASSLRVFDSLIIHYDASKGGVRQPVHRDGALISLNIALSHRSDYEGGGTFFEGLAAAERAHAAAGAPSSDVLPTASLGHPAATGDPSSATLMLDRGHVMCHASGLRHAGHRIRKGERWVLVVFLLATHVEHAPRRTAEHAWDALGRSDLGLAEAIWRAAIQMDDGDDELYYGLAQAQAMTGQAVEARRSLLTATQRYPLSPKPTVALGSLLLKARRTRAALRWFERTLALAADPADDEAWEAGCYAGLCGVRLAQAHPSRAPALLPRAEQTLRQALLYAPEHRREAIEGLLREAEAGRAHMAAAKTRDSAAAA